MKVFIAGIMQGSRQDRFIGSQDYRRIIAEILQARRPGIEILDPNELHPNGVEYDDNLAKATLIEMANLAAQSDLLIAYAPRASMGTALEMWQAFQAGVPVVTISPMIDNWVVKHLSVAVLPDLEAFRSWVGAGQFDNLAKLD